MNILLLYNNQLITAFNQSQSDFLDLWEFDGPVTDRDRTGPAGTNSNYLFFKLHLYLCNYFHPVHFI